MLRCWLGQPPLVQFQFRIALRNSIVEEPSLYGQLNENRYWHRRAFDLCSCDEAPPGIDS
jgi:hypothetical protein